MIAILHFVTLVITTMFAAAAAALVNWLLLRGTFHFLRPATAGRRAAANAALPPSRFPLNTGTSQVIRALSARR